MQEPTAVYEVLGSIAIPDALPGDRPVGKPGHPSPPFTLQRYLSPVLLTAPAPDGATERTGRTMTSRVAGAGQRGMGRKTNRSGFPASREVDPGPVG